MDTQTKDFYDGHAGRLAVEYAKADGDELYALGDIFAKARKILDIGCGTGRDSVYLLRRGKDVYGVDPSEAMLEVARKEFRRQDLDPDDRLFQGALPDLGLFSDNSFDGIYCNAVLMHLPEELLFDAAYTLKRLLRPGGTLMVSIPESRPDVDAGTRRDVNGRLFNGIPAAKLNLLLERIGFDRVSSETIDDSLGRSGYRWTRSVFTLLDEAEGRPLQIVEGILNRDDKVATYKLALFRALAEIAQTQHHLADYGRPGKVGIPLSAVAEKWLLYYWPIFEHPQTIRQGTANGTSDVAIRGKLSALVEHYRTCGGAAKFYVDWQGDHLSPEAQKLTNAALFQLRSTIWTMPVRHAGGGDFSVLQYDKQAKAIVMDATLWRELCLMGSWIQDATILRWAGLTEQINKGAFKASQVIDCLLTTSNAERNVRDARDYYASMTDRRCVWTAATLRNDFAVDHAMPFALWRNNDLWNLFPSAVTINNSKSDRLPTYNLLQCRRDLIIDCWQGLHTAHDTRFRREAQNLLGRDSFRPERWESQLFTRFVEAFETTAAQRNAPRWEPSEFIHPKSTPTVNPKPKHPPYPIPETKPMWVD